MRKSNKKSDKPKADENDRQKFPGYPKYPDQDDITRQNLRLSMNEEGVATTPENLSRKADLNENQEDIIVPSSRKRESDLTKEDLQALGPKDLSMDMGEDEDLLKHRSQPVDFAGEDLDVPGSELDDDSESIGTEDEENNNYSLGSDKHEDLDERHSL
jgi:hypothetical protein